MKESISVTRSVGEAGDSDSPASRDQLFGELALRSGLVDEATLRKASSQQGKQPGQPLAEILVQSGSLSEKARLGLQLLLEEHLSKQGNNREASISSVASFATVSFNPVAIPPAGEVTTTHQPANGEGSPPTKSFGHYELIREIARGGMGVVYQARQTRLNRLVALKMIRSGGFASPEDVKRFYAEAEAAARLDHPGIVPVYEVGEIEGQHFFSMAFVQGESLSNRVKGEGPLEPKLAAELLRIVAEAVQYAHDKGIVHRDIKPHNILLDENQQPRVADFGLAKQVQGASELTTTGQIMGTPSYMSPEQAAGSTSEIGPAADVYSLGATLYCLLTGRPPFQASSMAETIRQVLDNPPVPLRTLNPEIPGDLETICLKCLRKEPGSRYGSAQELADDLSRFLDGEPILARPVGALERGVKWMQRRPITAALGGVSVVAAFALVGAGISIAYQMRLSSLNNFLEVKNSELDLAEKTAAKARDEANVQRDAANDAKKQLALHRYASDIAIAGRAWREGDVGRMLGLLERHIPKKGEEDLRGIEWYYLWGQERQDLWRGEGGMARLSPNGKFLAMGSQEEIRLLEPRTRKVIRTIPGSSAYGGFAFSGDSRRLIAPVGARQAAIWDVETGEEITRLQADDVLVAIVGLSEDGHLAATCGTGDDHSVRLWDVATGKQLQIWSKRGGYYSLGGFSPDSKQFAFLDGGDIKVQDLKEGKLAWSLPGTGSRITDLNYHPSGAWLMAAHDDDTVAFFEAASGQPISPPVLSKGLRGNSLAVTPDGNYFLTGVSKDNTIRLWDCTTGAELSSRKGHLQKPSHVSLHPDGKLALSQSVDGGARLWDMRGTQDARNLAGPFQGIRDVTFSPDPKSPILAYLEATRKLVVFDGTEHRVLTGPENQIYRFAFSPDGKQIVAAHYNATADIWDVATGKRLHGLQEPAGKIVEVAFNHAGTMVATASMDKTIRVWDAQTGLQLHQFPYPMTNNGMLKLYFQPRTDDLISAQSFDGYQIFHLGATPQIQSFTGKVMTYDLTFSPDGTRVVTSGGGAFGIVVYTFPEFEQVHLLLGHSDFVGSVHFSPDGRRLATISADETIKIWDMVTGQELLTLPAPPPGYDLTWSADGRRIATGGQGNTILIWDSGRGYDEKK